jgi:UDP-N-acetylglucosamine 2-epimerase (non-hydrolysing)/GDP/UDP-N,N'-diacetylbacillosamine 2-epimerase (hydrolysing)
MKRYLSALRYVAAVVGNSSSGIVEVPTVHIPTVNIGVRQRGRLAGDSVINSGDSADDITRAIRLALSDEGQDRAARADNPYYKPDTLSIMVNAIMSVDPDELKHKHFHDIPTNQL